MKPCSICGKIIENENAPVLTISAYGNPRYICDDCAAKMDVAMESKDAAEIESAIVFLGDKMKDMKDGNSVAEVCNFIALAGERLKKIKDGSYDFATDEKIKEIKSKDDLEDIPEELQELEEDRELDEREAEKQKKFDNAMNWISLAAIVVTIAVILINLLK